MFITITFLLCIIPVYYGLQNNVNKYEVTKHPRF